MKSGDMHIAYSIRLGNIFLLNAIVLYAAVLVLDPSEDAALPATTPPYDKMSWHVDSTRPEPQQYTVTETTVVIRGNISNKSTLKASSSIQTQVVCPS